ncbi:MAG TPA: Ig-like domain-containing protein, partial [Thermoplasmata archaeon]|nr:Ig-like domain-containing protein [Thermoplasmata archaeon]
VALDRAGNRAEASAAVTIDYTAPVVSITSPGAGTTVSGELTVGWSASDAGSGIARTELFLDEDAPRVVTEGTSYRIANPQVGPHVAIVRVWDAAGNVAEDSSAYAYAPGSVQGPLSLPALEFWLLMVLIGAIAVGSAYYAVRRRKRAQV